jgi:DDE superfamily endonuclease
MRDLADIHYPDADQIRVLMDNLSTHTAGALYESLPVPEAHRVLQRLEFHDTPNHASWLNMVEIEIGVLRGQFLDRRIACGPRFRDRRVAAATQRVWRADQLGIHKAKGAGQAGTCLSGRGQRIVITVLRY